MRERRKQVAIFGGGIAGLTAAHELVERGFFVEVFERLEPSGPDQRNGVPCALGGMARTQWGRVERDEPFGDPPQPPMTPVYPLQVVLDAPVEAGSRIPRLRILFKEKKWKNLPNTPPPYVEPPAVPDSLVKPPAVADTLDEVSTSLTKHAEIGLVEVRGYCSATEEPDDRGLDVPPLAPGAWYRNWPPRTIAGKRAKHVATRLVVEHRIAAERLLPMGLGIGHADDWTMVERERRYVGFHVRENWLPGEHGFRYFPAYYRNVFDTMRRTPIPDDHDSDFNETPRTVLDNLVPTTLLAFSTESTPEPFPYISRPVLSVQVMFDQLLGMLKATGGTLADIHHFQLKMFKYMTSCRKRREGYAGQSWFDFLEAWQMSENFRQHLDGGGEVLVSMQAKNCDARSYGSASVQVLSSMLDPFGRTDATLNAPTSVAWFDPWRSYLARQGVVFRRGELEEIHQLDEQTAWPVVNVGGVKTVIDRDYYVLALGAADLQDVVMRSTTAGEDFERIRTFPLGDPSKPRTGGALEHMSGIQFYFATDFKFIAGHVMFPDSDFRLSAIFQPQFWLQKRGWWSGYRGILSVDISNWHRGSTWAWDLTGPQLAEAVLEQVAEGFRAKTIGRRWGATPTSATSEPASRVVIGPLGFGSSASLIGIQVPTALHFHIDQDMKYGVRAPEEKERPYRNRSPYLMCRPGEYSSRPGKPGEYTLQNGNFVIAGTLMQTHMRLTTMEAANESGRHAANAILKKEGFGPPAERETTKGELCQVYDLEEYEPDDLRVFQQIDNELCELGLPHFMDVLDLHVAQPECDLRDDENAPSATGPDGPLLELRTEQMDAAKKQES